MRFVIAMNDLAGAWDRLDPETQGRVLDQHRDFEAALAREGALVDALHLAPPDAAHTISRDADGRVEVSDGMAIHGGEHLGGLYVIDVPDEAAALEWARRARFIPGCNVLRRVLDD